MGSDLRHPPPSSQASNTCFSSIEQAAFLLDTEFHPPNLIGRRPPPPPSSHSVTLVLLDIDVSWLAYWNFSLMAYNTGFELACITRGPLYLVFTLHVCASLA
ncbi:hypothetical protein RHSIM_Rhsim09G0161300 [Rhododendron simsii]|uniref:Uncharacterized protein n=1 Tax=Rhododendron simsii TaxID=118357 RepID=A0A834GDQ6_RHOSS|nr:hypothetical protein RHSIM_Rhsim09G0161300 [Rhododendron simsii]